MKKNRQMKILEIISKYEVETQDDLIELLKSEDYYVTQATISRDIRELEDEDVFSGCDSLSEITFAGSEAAWESLNRGKTLTVQRSDLSLYSPKINCLDLKNEI